MQSGKISLLLILLVCYAIIAFIRPFAFIDNLLFDFNFRMTTAKSSDSVVVVCIDSRSIHDKGAMPWPRRTIAELFKKIDNASPRAIAADFLFPQRIDSIGNDSLSSVLAEIDNIVLPFRIDSISGSDTNNKALPNEIKPHVFHLIKNREFLENNFFYSAKSTDFGDHRFYSHATYSGFINISTNRSTHTLREAIHCIRSGDDYLYSFAIAAAASFYRLKKDGIILDGKGNIILRERKIPLSSYAASTNINFRRDISSQNCVSAGAVLDGSFDANKLKGKLVFIGITDPAAGVDFFTTPVSVQTPGVIIWANIALDILENRWLRENALLDFLVNIILCLAIFPVSCIVFRKKRRIAAIPACAALVICGFFISYLAFRNNFIFMASMQVYSFFFALIWLSVVRVSGLGTLLPQRFEPYRLIGADTLPPPSASELNETLPETSTLYHVRNLPQYKDSGDISDSLYSLGSGRIIKSIGSGGMADIYLIWNMKLDLYRAVKVINPHMPENFMEKFDIEGRIFSKLDHQNIVHCFSVGTWHTLPYLEMEFVNGASFDNIIFKCKSLSAEQALITGIIICNALQYAHNQVITIHSRTYKGIIHRDIKPANIMISRSGRIKLTDFGIAHPGSTGGSDSGDEGVPGTLPYLAPEQFDNCEVTPQIDIYALGTTLYELLSGKRAFPQTDATHLLKAKVSDSFEPLHHVCHIDKSISSVIEKAMSFYPENRFSTAGEFGEELEKALMNHFTFRQDRPLTDLVAKYWDR